MMLQSISIIVQGKVQGVFFRQSTKEKAIELGVKGQVKNMPDETVHIIATGTVGQLERLISWCWHGPPKADVENIITEEIPLQLFERFSISR